MKKAADFESAAFQIVKKPLWSRIRSSWGGGARGGSRPPRMESNAPEALLCKNSGKRSEDFCAAQRRKSNGIFTGCQKSPWTFLTACDCAAHGRHSLFGQRNAGSSSLGRIKSAKVTPSK